MAHTVTHVGPEHKMKQPYMCAIQAENNQQKCKYFFFIENAI